MRQIDRHRHQGRGFVASIPKHHPLVARPDRVNLRLAHGLSSDFQRMVDALGDVRGLLCKRQQHAAGIAVEAFFARIVANLQDHLSGQLVKIYLGVGRDLA